MSLFKGEPVKIIGTGAYVPEKVMTNFDFEKILDTNNQWIVERTGISKRHFASDEQKCSDLAANAGAAALADAGISAEELDLVIVATNSPDCICPCTAARVQGAIGAVNAGAYDITSGCTGSLTALLTAIGFILSRALSGLSTATFPEARKHGMLADFMKDARKKTVAVCMLVIFFLTTFLELLFGGICGGVVVITTVLIFLWYRHMAVQEFGGVTGDLAGFFLQICELGILLAAVIGKAVF